MDLYGNMKTTLALQIAQYRHLIKGFFRSSTPSHLPLFYFLGKYDHLRALYNGEFQVSDMFYVELSNLHAKHQNRAYEILHL